MKHRTILLVLIAVLAGVALAALANQQSDYRSDKPLFVNLTHDETNRAAMAISLAHNALKMKHVPVTIFLNVAPNISQRMRYGKVLKP